MDDIQTTEQVGTTDTQSQQEQVTITPSYDSSKSLSENARTNPINLEESLTELDKLDKFKWKGKVYTGKELEAMAMMESDYTKKTQSLASQEKFYKNLPYDLLAIKDRPELAEAFRNIYPREFHSYLKTVINGQQVQSIDNPNQVSRETNGNGNQGPSSSSIVNDSRLDELYEDYKSTKFREAETKTNALFDQLIKQYPDADEGKILARVQAQLERAKLDSNVNKPTEKDIEKMFKDEHSSFEKKLKERASKLLEEQRRANTRGATPLAGGGIPGKAPVQPRTIREATRLMQSDGTFS